MTKNNKTEGKTLDMSLKRVYLEPTRQGVKKVEHRDMTLYWTEKLVDIESYGGKSVDEIRCGLIDGTLEFKPRNWSRILFHESGSQNTLLVEVKSINHYVGHRNFHIELGEVLQVGYGKE